MAISTEVRVASMGGMVYPVPETERKSGKAKTSIPMTKCQRVHTVTPPREKAAEIRRESQCLR
jgi:hypothetical protein